MKVTVEQSDKCIVRIGSIARSDPDTELHVVKKEDETWKRIRRIYVEGQKSIHLGDLEEGEYMLGLFGNKIAGVATTAGFEVPFPFNVYLETPEDHSKDFMRIDIPANKPVPPTLADMIRSSLK